LAGTFKFSPAFHGGSATFLLLLDRRQKARDPGSRRSARPGAAAARQAL